MLVAFAYKSLREEVVEKKILSRPILPSACIHLAAFNVCAHERVLRHTTGTEYE